MKNKIQLYKKCNTSVSALANKENNLVYKVDGRSREKKKNKTKQTKNPQQIKTTRKPAMHKSAFSGVLYIHIFIYMHMKN